MTCEEFHEALKLLGLRLATAPRALGISPKLVMQYADGWKIPRVVAKLLRFMLKYGINGDKDAFKIRRGRKLPPFSTIARHGYELH
jgi:hypothetical protein